jgi:cobalt-zinc-cadmium efflux system membrane fusion protein
MRIAPQFLRAFVLGAALLISTATQVPAAAHAGHDDAEQPLAAGSGAPRAEASSPDFEIVAVAADHRLKIYLDRFATNEPIDGASLEVAENGGEPLKAAKQDDGTFLLRAPWIDVGGKHDLTFTVVNGDVSDLLTAAIQLPEIARAAVVAPASAGARVRVALGERVGTVTMALAFLLGVLTVITVQTRGRWRALAGALTVLVGVMIGGVAFAHGGEDHGDAPAPQPAGLDVPRRQPDGAVAMPKDAQRLLAVRTQQTLEATASRTVQIIGQVTPDPNAAGRVQSSQSGRIESGDKGIAHVGQLVKAGDVLAVIAPAIAAVERGTVGTQVADADQQVRTAEQKVSRLSGLVGSVAGKEIDEARAELVGARARRAAVSQTLAGREILRSPVSGIVSVASAVNGQFVEGKDILFEIVDPTRLWVEAVGFDPSLAGEMRGASALLTDSTPIKIELVGRGLALRQGATPLLFRIVSPPAGLSVGAPVSVIANVAVDAIGISLPRSSVVRMPNGGSAVWDHVSAERFVPRPVRLQALDGANVLIVAGLKPGQRIVTQGADLLNQVR